jgi:hypothetical protein
MRSSCRQVRLLQPVFPASRALQSSTRTSLFVVFRRLTTKYSRILYPRLDLKLRHSTFCLQQIDTDSEYHQTISVSVNIRHQRIHLIFPSLSSFNHYQLLSTSPLPTRWSRVKDRITIHYKFNLVL